MTLYDAYGRPFKSLRVAVTYACNFDCIFCHREGVKDVSDELEWHEMALVGRASRELGAEDVKLTGGEPLVKRGIVELVDELNEIGFKDISMTTNGYLLKHFASKLSHAGLKRVNVSLHSLKRERFAYITGVDGLERVLEGIQAALESGLKVFINITLLKGINDDEVMDIINFATNRGMSVHLIELHPVGKAKENFNKLHSFPRELVSKLAEASVKVERRSLHNRIRYVMSNGSVVELVQPVSNPLFCAGCMRIRLSPDGKLYPCLNEYEKFVDIKGIVKSDLDNEMKVEMIKEALHKVNKMRKPFHMWNLEYEREVIMKNFEEYKVLFKDKILKFRLEAPLAITPNKDSQREAP